MADDHQPAFDTLYLLRHGETEFNRRGLTLGSLDLPLTPTGRDQAAAAAARTARRKRTRNLTLIISGALLLAAVVTIAVSQLFGARADNGVAYTQVEKMTVGEPVKVLPGFSETATWEHTISEDSAVTAFPQAVVVAANAAAVASTRLHS